MFEISICEETPCHFFAHSKLEFVNNMGVNPYCLVFISVGKSGKSEKGNSANVHSWTVQAETTEFSLKYTGGNAPT